MSHFFVLAFDRKFRPGAVKEAIRVTLNEVLMGQMYENEKASFGHTSCGEGYFVNSKCLLYCLCFVRWWTGARRSLTV